MAITYTWKMKEIKIVDQTNSEGKVLKDAVVQTLWQKIGKDDEGNEGIFMGATPLTAVNVPEADFKELGWDKTTDVAAISCTIRFDYAILQF